jgi:hypothetical protein
MCRLAAFSQDLAVSSYYNLSPIDRYSQYDYGVDIKNIGIVETTSNYFTVEWYLSTDNQLQVSTDILMTRASTYIPTIIKAGAKVTLSPSIESSYVNAAPGTYYLIIRILRSVQETDYTNNMVVLPNFVVSPPHVDFTITSFNTYKTTYTHAEVIPVKFIGENRGTTRVGGPLKYRFLISKDATRSADDIAARFDGHPDDGASFNLTGYKGFESPNTTSVLTPIVPPGDYYILAVIDEDASGAQRYDETDETNNVAATPITIQAADIDLALISSDIKQSPASNTLFTGTVVIRNNSETSLSGYEIKLELVPTGTGKPASWNNNYDNTYRLSYLNIGSNTESRELTLSVSMQMKQLPAGGTYDIVVGVNPNQKIPERDYSNNVYIQAGQLVIEQQPVRAIALRNVTVTGAIDNTKKQIPISLEFENTGDLSDFSEGYTLSIVDAQGLTMKYYIYGLFVDFAPGQSKVKTAVLNIDTPLPSGDYKIVLACESQCNTTPSEMSGAFTVTSPKYIVSGHVRGEDGTPITKGKMFLYRKEASGRIRFTQTIDPYDAETFSLTVDTDPSTLYFMPDRVAYPEYVPTIYGKTLTLQPSNFFTATKDMSVVMEVIKVQPLAYGTGVISGRLAAGQPAGRGIQPMSTESVEDVPVILLSSTGQPVAITYTDASGYYEFKNLPRTNYQLLASFELDTPALMEPYTVDITTKNAQVNLKLTPEGIAPEASQLFLPQVLTFSALTAQRYGNATTITLDARADTGLPIAYTSSDESVATIVDGKAIIHETGETTISASQAGDDFYQPATTTQVLTVNKAIQAIEFEALPDRLNASEPFTLMATASSGLAVSFESSDESIVSIEGNIAHVHESGSVAITARQEGNRNYEAASLSREQRVAVITSIEDPTEGANVYPNPTTGTVFIGLPDVRGIEVSDTAGRRFSLPVWQNSTLDLSHLPAGIYIVKISVSSRTIVVKVLKR